MTLVVRTFAQQKAALTRALKKPEGPEREKAVEDECARAKGEWESRQGQFTYGWPDDWARWQRALDDSRPWGRQVRLEML